MIVDGRAIRDELLQQVKQEVAVLGRPFSLGIFVSHAPDFATESFIRIKKRAADAIGIEIVEYAIREDATTESVIADIARVAEKHDGIIVQCPLPPAFDIDQIRNAVPIAKDVDALSDAAIAAFESGDAKILTPVVAALAEICKRGDVTLNGKNAVVLGHGRLVGKPAATWLRLQGADVTVLDKSSPDIDAIQHADILVLGAGVPGLVTPSMIKDGVILFDAGTSEAEGKLAGDADPACADKATLFTPVPGGIGPITVAFIFKNLARLATSK